MRTLLILACLVAGPVSADSDAASLLATADRYRLGGGNLQVDTRITTLQADGTVDKERRYTVYAQANHQSLVLMQSPAEKGQKVLMLGDDFWMLMPGSQRPLRITPMQKLLGDASTGDIATAGWAEDYEGVVAGEGACGEPAQPCVHLSLTARRPGVTYRRIELWVGQQRGEPVTADLYVQSDKLAKQARFVVSGPAVTEMRLRDQLTNKRETRVEYVSRQPRTVPEAWLNPMYLARNPSLE